MGDTVIDGAGQWSTISFESLSDKVAKISDLKIQRYNGTAIGGLDGHTDFTIGRVEVDGSNATSDYPFFGGILLVVSGTNSINNVYIHDIVSDITNVGAAGIGVVTGHDFSGSISVDHTTIENIGTTQLSNSSSDGITALSGVIDGTMTPAALNMNISNTTITNVHSATKSGDGVSIIGVVNGGTTSINMSARNNTITNLSGKTSEFGEPAGFVMVAAAVQDSDRFNLNFESTNNFLDSNNSSAQNCFLKNVADIIPGGATGTVNLSLSSLGGNLSDDNSCKNYFTKPTDQNNVSALADTLAPLSDNGGYVPTMALKKGSPAIDAGITIPTLTTDARGSVRPQGTAYDSGAYESPYSKPASTESLAGTGVSVQGVAVVAASVCLFTTFIAGWQLRRRLQ